MTAPATTMYAAALTQYESPPTLGADSEWVLRSSDGTATNLGSAIQRWCSPIDEVDTDLLSRCVGAVLDVGCGPGRLVAALNRQGRTALGVDIVETAVLLARRSGSAALHRSVFDRLPGEGRWGSVLLADGNIGIGGDPVRLLRRCRDLIDPAGQVIVELGPPDHTLRRTQVRLEWAKQTSSWFAWATVASDAIDEPALAAGLTVVERWERGDRWFASLMR